MKKLVILALTFSLIGVAAAQGPTTELVIEDQKTEPVPLQAGEYATVWLRVTNKGNSEARDPEFEVLENYPFQPVDKTEWSVDGGLQPGESYDMRVELKVNENAPHGTNNLEIRKSSTGENFIVEKVPLDIRTDNRSLVVSELEFPRRVAPGSSAEMNLSLENQANSRFKNIDVTLDTEGIPIAATETSRKRISNIDPEKSAKVSYTIDVDQDADNQLLDLPITIDYQNQAGDELSMSETTGVSVGGYPNVEVDIEESEIKSAEQRGTITLRILNRGEGQARFAQVDLQESDQYEILSQDSVYLGTMIADDYQTAEFDVYVEDGAESLEMPVDISYRDGDGEQARSFSIDQELYTSSELSRYGMRGDRGYLVPVTLLFIFLGLGGVYYWRRIR